MAKENMLDGTSEGEVNISSALMFLEELESLPNSELSLHSEEMQYQETALRDLQKQGVDTPAIRNALSRLSYFREKAEKN